MAANKTTATGASVDDFLATIPEPRQTDARELNARLIRLAGRQPTMWGTSIVGFGERRLINPSGRELDWFEIGYSPRKAALTLYLTDGVDWYGELLARLGPHRTGVGCLYLKRLGDVDPDVLDDLISRALSRARST